MKTRQERLWDAFNSSLACGASSSAAMENAIEATDYFDAHCPRSESDRKVSEELSDPVRAAAIAWVEARGKCEYPAALMVRARGNSIYANERNRLADLLDAVAAERGETEQGCVAQRTEQRSSNPLVAGSIPAAPTNHAEIVLALELDLSNANRARYAAEHKCNNQRAEIAKLNRSRSDLRKELEKVRAQTSKAGEVPAPNWRALVENLKRACETHAACTKALDFTREENWPDQYGKDIARAVSALIAALDKPERIDFRENSHERTQELLVQSNGMISALRKENSELSSEMSKVVCILSEAGAWPGSSASEATQKMVSECGDLRAAIEATRKELAEARGPMGTIDNMRNILGASEGEPNLAAARRVVAERNDWKHAFDRTVKERDELRAKLAEVCAERGELKAKLDREQGSNIRDADRARAILGAAVGEHWLDAAQRVVAELHEIKTSNVELRDDCGALHDQVDQLKAKLAAADELRDAAVEYVEADISYCSLAKDGFERLSKSSPEDRARIGRAGLRYLAARDAAAKNGGV